MSIELSFQSVESPYSDVEVAVEPFTELARCLVGVAGEEAIGGKFEAGVGRFRAVEGTEDKLK